MSSRGTRLIIRGVPYNQPTNHNESGNTIEVELGSWLMIRGERCGDCRVGEDVAHLAGVLGDKCEIFGAGEWFDEFRKQVNPLKIFLVLS